MDSIVSQLVDASLYSISVERGEGLGSFDLNGKSDPYVIVSWNGSEVGRTEVQKATLDPKWNKHTFKLGLLPDTEDGGGDRVVLLLEVWDEDRIGKDDFMGHVSLSHADLKRLRNAGMQKLPLACRPNSKAKNEGKGDLHVSISFVAPVDEAVLVANRERLALKEKEEKEAQARIEAAKTKDALLRLIRPFGSITRLRLRNINYKASALDDEDWNVLASYIASSECALQALDISGNSMHFPAIEIYKALGSNTSLIEFRAATVSLNNKEGAISTLASSLAQNKTLRILDLTGCACTPEELLPLAQAVAQNEVLEQVELSCGGEVGQDHALLGVFKSFITAHPSLKRVRLLVKGCVALYGEEACKPLEELHLAALKADIPRILGFIQRNLPVARLDLGGNIAWDKETLPKLLDALEQNTQIVALELPKTQFDTQMAEALGTFLAKDTCFIRELNLTGLTVGVASILSNARRLRRLELHTTEVRKIDGAWTELRNLVSTSTVLERLTLSSCEIGRYLLELREALARNKSVIHLDLSYGNADIPEMAKTLEINPQLKSVSFANNKIFFDKDMPEFCSNLKKHPSLELLDLSNCSMEQGRVRQVLQSLPPTLKRLYINGESNDCNRRWLANAIKSEIPQSTILEEIQAWNLL